MQKIKYLVGSKLSYNIKSHFEDNKTSKIKIIDISSNKFLAAITEIDDGISIKWVTQEHLDICGYKLESTPRWIPEKGEVYYCVNSYGTGDERIWESSQRDIFTLKNDNVFRTTEECQKKIDEINLREI